VQDGSEYGANAQLIAPGTNSLLTRDDDEG